MDYPFHWVGNLRCRKVEVKYHSFHRSPLEATHRQMVENTQFDHVL
jgi:hypothetical protein